MSDYDRGTVSELSETIDEIKHRWQQGDHLDLPGPIEQARTLVDQLDGGDGSDGPTREDVLYGTVLVHDLCPREELHARAVDDARGGLEQFDVDPDDAEIRWAMVEDGVLHYKIEHENIPKIQYDYALPDGGQCGGDGR